MHTLTRTKATTDPAVCLAQPSLLFHTGAPTATQLTSKGNRCLLFFSLGYRGVAHENKMSIVYKMKGHIFNVV